MGNFLFGTSFNFSMCFPKGAHLSTVQTEETVETLETVMAEDLKNYDSHSDNLKARNASAFKSV